MLTHRRVCLQPARHSTTFKSPFEVVYGFNPLSPLDILSVPHQELTNMNASARAEFMKIMHNDTRLTIERKVQRHTDKVNFTKKPTVFITDDLVWVNLRKDHFSKECKFKLLP